jgi:hypothetical protein
VLLDVGGDALAELVRTDELLEHAENGRALLVRQHVEHGLGLFRATDGKLDGAGTRQAVHAHRLAAARAEAHPPLPLGPEVVDAHQLHERGEGLVEPDAVPPLHGHEVAEPHVGDLVGDHVGHPLELEAGRDVAVDEQRRLPEGHGAEVLHGAEGEVGHGDEVELVAGVGEPEVVGEVAEGVGADLEGEVPQARLARHCGDAQRDTVHLDRLGELEGADHEGDEIGRHAHRLGERDLTLAVAEVGLLLDGGVGDGGEPAVDDERHRECRLAIGLVPAREGAARVGALELRGRDDVLVATLVGERAAVEAPQLVVEDPGEGQLERPVARLGLAVERDGRPVVLLVQRDRALQAPALVGGELGAVDLQFGGVEHHVGDGLVHDDPHPLLAREGRRVEVGAERELVVLGLHAVGQTVDARVLGHVGTLPGHDYGPFHERADHRQRPRRRPRPCR